jgi:hypothetical protein
MFALGFVILGTRETRAQLESDRITGIALARITNLERLESRLEDALTTTPQKIKALQDLTPIVEGMAPTDKYYEKWVNYYNKKREQYYADRANDETAKIKLADLQYKSERFLKDNEGKIRNADTVAALRTAIAKSAAILRRYNDWVDREWRPRELRRGGLGSPPTPTDGVPVIDVVYDRSLNDYQVVNVNEDVSVQAHFVNNTDKRIWAEVQLVPIANVAVEPAKKLPVEIAPRGRSGTFTWNVRVLKRGAFELTITREVKAYWPHP